MIRKIRFISKFMTWEIGKETITIHILPNISRTKGNQSMKLSQLLEYNMKNIFLEKSYTKYDGETNPRPFSKKSKLSMFLDQQSEILYRLFLLHVQKKVYHNLLKLRCKPLSLPLYKVFLFIV